MKYSSLVICLASFLTSCIPKPNPYPYKAAAEIREEATQISVDLEAYIIGWLEQINPPQIPDSLIPDGVVDAESFELIHPDSASFEDTWVWRYAKAIDTDSLYNSLPDPNVTYLLLGPALAPYGSKLHVEGAFPHCRFFSLQMTPPLSGEEYNYDRAFGPAEVSIADVDIDPLPGHVNPFRMGTDRNASQRSFHVVFNLSIGNPVSLSGGNFAPPYRYAGNERYGGLLQYQGPWGIAGGFGGITPGTGAWRMGSLWVRIYAPDGPDPLGDVAPPRVYYELPDGRTYFVKANFNSLKDRVDKTVPAQKSKTSANKNISPDLGWQKSYGVLMNILVGVSQVNGWLHPDTMEKIRAVDLGATGRSQFATPPRNYEAHATVNNYTSYLGKFVRLDEGEVAVFTGKLPTFPDTRSGMATLEDAQCRYWSLIGYDNDPFFEAPGSAVTGIMDDQVILDESRNYILAFSRQEDRPVNALPEHRVSWVDWGPTMDLGFIIRTVTLGTSWNFSQSPTAPSLPWSTGNLASPTYDSTLINQNWHKGYLGCYLPRLHILTKEAFEALGDDFHVTDIPIWIHDRPEIGLSESLNLPIRASSTKGNTEKFAISHANDADYESAWSSQNLSRQRQEEWIEIDLLTEKRITGLKFSWVLFAHATDYQIQVSSDAENWEVVYETSQGKGGIVVVDQLRDVVGRFVRINLQRSTLFNYGLKNVEVYGPQTECFTESNVPTKGSLLLGNSLGIWLGIKT